MNKQSTELEKQLRELKEKREEEEKVKKLKRQIQDERFNQTKTGKFFKKLKDIGDKI